MHGVCETMSRNLGVCFFSRVIPEYSRTLEESDILDNAFQIVFAFYEIVALGYRESVNLAQIRSVLLAMVNINELH